MSIFRRNQVNSSPEKPKFKVKISPRNPWFWLLTLTFVVLTSWLPAMAGTARHYTDLTFPTLPAIKLPDYERYQLKNGMILYLMPDKELPLVGGSAIIRTGDRWEPKLVETLTLLVMGMQQGLSLPIAPPKITSGIWLLDAPHTPEIGIYTG